jgi:hypothetical protein
MHTNSGWGWVGGSGLEVITAAGRLTQQQVGSQSRASSQQSGYGVSVRPVAWIRNGLHGPYGPCPPGLALLWGLQCVRVCCKRRQPFLNGGVSCQQDCHKMQLRCANRQSPLTGTGLGVCGV